MDLLRVQSLRTVVISAEAAEQLSPEALGLLVKLASWNPRQRLGIPALARSLGLPETRLSRLLAELAEHGFARLETIQSPSGKFQGKVWVILPFGDIERKGNLTERPKNGASVEFAAVAGKPKRQTRKSAKEGNSTETPKIGVSVTLPKGSAETPPDNSARPKCARNDPSGGNGAQTCAGALAASHFSSVKERKDILNNSQLPVTDVWGQEVDTPGLDTPSLDKPGLDKPSLDKPSQEAIDMPGMPEDEPEGRPVCPTSIEARTCQTTDKPGAARSREPAYTRKPVQDWKVNDFLAYMLDQARAAGKPVLMPKAAMGQHLRWLWERAVSLFGAQGPMALKDLIDAFWLREANGTGWLLREAEWFFRNWHPVEEGEFVW